MLNQYEQYALTREFHPLETPHDNRSVDEVYTEEVQQQTPKDKIRKRPLMGNGLELGLVLWVGLDAQGSCEDKLADAGAEAGEEGVEGLGKQHVSLAWFEHWGLDM